VKLIPSLAWPELAGAAPPAHHHLPPPWPALPKPVEFRILGSDDARSHRKRVGADCTAGDAVVGESELVRAQRRPPPCFVSLTRGDGLSAVREREANMGRAVAMGRAGVRGPDQTSVSNLQFVFLFIYFTELYAIL
jgi:hypothetical protein